MDHAQLTGGYFLQAKNTSILVLQARSVLTADLMNYISRLEQEAFEAGQREGTVLN